MSKCMECKSFFAIPENDDDYEAGKGDCVREQQDKKGKWCSSKPTFENDTCDVFQKKN